MAKDPYMTKDGYHIEDVIANGRCLWCGKLGQTEHDFDSLTIHRKFCSSACRTSYQEIKGKLTEKGIE